MRGIVIIRYLEEGRARGIWWSCEGKRRMRRSEKKSRKNKDVIERVSRKRNGMRDEWREVRRNCKEDSEEIKK